jgi:hypothetical protein
VPVWVHLTLLPLKFCSEKALKIIGEGLGTCVVIEIDKRKLPQSMLGFA